MSPTSCAQTVLQISVCSMLLVALSTCGAGPPGGNPGGKSPTGAETGGAGLAAAVVN